MEITIARRTNEYATNRFQITSHPDLEAKYYSLREIANKFSSRNANAKKIEEYLDAFTRSLFAAIPQDADRATIDVDIAPLMEAIEVDTTARSKATPTHPCAGRDNGCVARVATAQTFCARCAHDED
jgi:hypothetical protein